jgi:hypothetical protein
MDFCQCLALGVAFSSTSSFERTSIIYRFDHSSSPRSDKTLVERRREPRFQTNATVTVTVLNTLEQPAMSGLVSDMSGRGLRLTVPHPIPYGAAVKVEGNDMLVLGDVSRCQPAGSGYTVGLALTHSLTMLAELASLNRALLGEGSSKGDRVRV